MTGRRKATGKPVAAVMRMQRRRELHLKKLSNDPSPEQVVSAAADYLRGTLRTCRDPKTAGRAADEVASVMIRAADEIANRDLQRFSGGPVARRWSLRR